MPSDAPTDTPSRPPAAAVPAAGPAPSTTPPGDDALPAEVLKRVPLMPRLRVPYTTRAAADSVRAKAPGTHVRRGEPVTETVPQSSHAPLAPADGVIAGIESVRLLDGRQAMAVDLEPSPITVREGAAPVTGPAAPLPRAQPSADLF